MVLETEKEIVSVHNEHEKVEHKLRLENEQQAEDIQVLKGKVQKFENDKKKDQKVFNDTDGR